MLKNITILILLINLSVYSQTINKAKLDSLFETLDVENKLMGSIFVTKNGKKIYKNTIGYSSIKNQSKASYKTKYRIASITKVYTATLIFQLVDADKLTLETPLANFFPKIKNAKKITIGNLLNHTSGIFNFTEQKDFNPYVALTHKQVLETIEQFDSNFEPGTKTAYSNTNFILLGYILEKIYNKPYAQILQNQIAYKLQLKNTYYGSSIDLKNQEALSYTFNNKWEISKETNMSIPHGAGAIVSTPQELTTFMNALMSGKIISDDNFKKMTTIKNGQLLGGPTGSNYEVLKAIKKHRFILESEGLTLDFDLDKNSLTLTQNGGKYIFTKK